MRAFRNTTLLAATIAGFGCNTYDTSGPSTNARRYKDVSAGYYHTCALSEAGTAYCWGQNEFGTIGDSTRTTRLSPTLVTGGLKFSALDAGAGHTCALASDGAVWCWGQNDEGQLGDGTFVPRDHPVRVAGMTFTSVSAGHAHSCGLASDGAAWCWGDNSHGQLGNAREVFSKSATPVRVAGSQRFASISAGYYQSCGLTANGEAYCWGLNDVGQNGDGTTQDQTAPVHASVGHVFSTLSPGDRFVCGISAGVTLCWGENANAFGNMSNAIVGIFSAHGASTVGGAEPYACGLNENGGALCWGGAIRGLRSTSSVARALDDKLSFQKIAPGAQHVCALTRDGYLYCGGGNYAGQVGDGTRIDRASLTLIEGN